MFAWISHDPAGNHLRVESAKYARMIFTEVSMFDGLSAIPHLNPLPLANGEVGIGSFIRDERQMAPHALSSPLRTRTGLR